MGHYHDEMKQAQASGRELREHIPEVYSGFVRMHKAAMEDGAHLTATTTQNSCATSPSRITTP